MIAFCNTNPAAKYFLCCRQFFNSFINLNYTVLPKYLFITIFTPLVDSNILIESCENCGLNLLINVESFYNWIDWQTFQDHLNNKINLNEDFKMSEVSIDNIENAIKKLTADILEGQERAVPYTPKKKKSRDFCFNDLLHTYSECN